MWFVCLYSTPWVGGRMPQRPRQFFFVANCVLQQNTLQRWTLGAREAVYASMLSRDWIQERCSFLTKMRVWIVCVCVCVWLGFLFSCCICGGSTGASHRRLKVWSPFSTCGSIGMFWKFLSSNESMWRVASCFTIHFRVRNLPGAKFFPMSAK